MEKILSKFQKADQNDLVAITRQTLSTANYE